MTGAAGQVGGAIAPRLRAQGHEVVATDRATLDLADPAAIVDTLDRVRPEIIVNAGAYTAVDQAERERDAAFAINAVAPGVLAAEAKRRRALLVHFSTDYVFDGRANAPYSEDDETAPLSVYGASKLAGEQAVLGSGADSLVFRTSWVYGWTGRNFLLTIRRLASERAELRIVADQRGVPNWSDELARAVVRVLALGDALRERRGLYHLSSSGDTTWHGFAEAIVGSMSAPRVVPISTADYPTPARRPPYGVLATARFERNFGFALPPWRDALDACLRVPPAAPAVV